MYNEKFIPKEETIYLDGWRVGYRDKYVKKCSWCNQEFDTYPIDKKNWCYKMIHNHMNRYFCSWNCQMQYEKAKVKHNEIEIDF